jgi:hypothetical protein
MGRKVTICIRSLTAPCAQLNPLTPTQNIANGTGWATDLQSIAISPCYQPSQIIVEPQSILSGLSQSYTAAEIAETLQITLDLNIAFAMFQATAMYDYLSNMTSNSYTLTANYYFIVQEEITLQYNESGVALLTDLGKSVYDLGKNPQFRILCGDTLISSYTMGAAILLSVSLEFGTTADMLAMKAALTDGFGPYANVAATISDAASQAGVSCVVIVTAIQFGGDTSDLGLILAANPGNCLSSNPEGCTPLINAITSYIGDSFLQQITNINMMPLGGLTLGESVKNYGLDPGQTTLTPEVLAAQSWILSTLFTFQNWYYAMTPIVLISTSLDPIFSEELSNHYSNLQYSIDWISSGGSMNFPPYTCFGVDPSDCLQTQIELIQALAPYNVTSADLTALFQSVKYKYLLKCGFDFDLYPIGNWDYIYEDVIFATSSQNFALQNGSFTAGPITGSPSDASGSFDYEEYNNEASAYQLMEVQFALNTENDGETLAGTIAVYKTNGEYFNFCPGTVRNTTTAIGSINPYWSNFTDIQINVTTLRMPQLSIADY